MHSFKKQKYIHYVVYFKMSNSTYNSRSYYYSTSNIWNNGIYKKNIDNTNAECPELVRSVLCKGQLPLKHVIGEKRLKLECDTP